MRISFFLLLILVLSACTSITFEDQLIGKWNMNQVFDKGDDVTQKHNAESDRYIIFNNDGTFKSGGGPGENTGKFYVNMASGRLYIDSDEGPEDDSIWEVSFSGDEMTWKGYGADWAERFTIVHKKTK